MFQNVKKIADESNEKKVKKYAIAVVSHWKEVFGIESVAGAVTTEVKPVTIKDTSTVTVKPAAAANKKSTVAETHHGPGLDEHQGREYKSVKFNRTPPGTVPPGQKLEQTKQNTSNHSNTTKLIKKKGSIIVLLKRRSLRC